ncbi:hypothetical protein K0B03_01280 [Patescibacteria group bacterium]|nr:hypothetical protein [Patescibacteria group bacterium]
MKNFFDRTLSFYFPGKLTKKTVVLLTSENFGQNVKLDRNNKCKWFEDEKRSAKKCLQAMEIIVI